MSEERLANALTRARLAADRIDKALSQRPEPETGGDENASLRAAVTPILAELDQLIANAEGRS